MPSVLIAETQPVYAKGLQVLLSQLDGLQLCQMTNSFSELFQILEKETANLLLLDAALNVNYSEEQLVHQLKQSFPELKIALFGKTWTLGALTRLRRLGLDAFLCKNITNEELIKAIYMVLDGHRYLQESIALALNCFAHNGAGFPKPGKEKLSDRELEVLSLIIEEYTNEDIAKTLCLAVPTIESHRKSLFSKLGVKNAAGLVREALLHGLYKNDHHGKP